MLTKKHYTAIAEIVRNATDVRTVTRSDKTRTVRKTIKADVLVSQLSRFFEMDNPNFQPRLFEAACLPKT
jgi:hypothetical protein